MALLKKKLVACVSVLNYAKSYYLWEWKIKKDEEKLVLMKYPQEKEQQLLVFLKQQHPYRVPELVVISPEMVDEKYLDWVHSVTM